MTDRARGALVVCAFGALVCGSAWALAGTAHAHPSLPIATGQADPAVDGEGLDAADSESRALSRLAPGDWANWYVDLTMNDPRTAEIALLLRADGELADVVSGPVVSVRTCSSPWVDAACPAVATTLVTDHPVRLLRNEMVPLGTFMMRQQVWLALTVRIPDDAPMVQERTAAHLVLEADPVRMIDEQPVEREPGAAPTTSLPGAAPEAGVPPTDGGVGAPSDDATLRTIRLTSPLEDSAGAGMPARLAFTGGDLAVLAVASLGSVLGGIGLARIGAGRDRRGRRGAQQ
jgi:hypothetical protein